MTEIDCFICSYQGSDPIGHIAQVSRLLVHAKSLDPMFVNLLVNHRLRLEGAERA